MYSEIVHVALLCCSQLVTWRMHSVNCEWIQTAWFASVGQVNGVGCWKRTLSLSIGHITVSHMYCLIC